MKLIADWRKAHRFWSARLSAAGVVVLMMLEIWNSLPDAVRALLPAHLLLPIGLALVALSIVARILDLGELGREDA